MIYLARVRWGRTQVIRPTPGYVLITMAWIHLVGIKHLPIFNFGCMLEYIHNITHLPVIIPLSGVIR